MYAIHSPKLKNGDNMTKKILACIFCAVSFSALAFDIRLEIDGSNRIDSWTKRGNMMLEGHASDGKTYRIRLSCISAERNHAQGFAIGEMHVYKGASHIGSKAVFDYEDCLSLYDSLKELSVKLTLDWDKKEYDANPTGKLLYSVESL
tara:strand:- start:3 stop:446 length:444 start_codon:yes stop_codon:yes gene_type:complete